MPAESIYLLAVLAAALVLLYKGWIRHDLTALLVMLATMLPWIPDEDGGLRGVLPVEEAVSGFGSTAIAMVASMFVLSAAMVRTGATNMLGGALLAAGARTELLFQLTVLGAITLFSAVINDTTTVLMWMPVVLGICRQRGYSPGRLLLVLACASLLGGQWTLIGTRSNIIVSDYLRIRTGDGLAFFSFTPVAAAVFAAVVVWFVLFGRRLLPAPREEPGLAARYDVQEFVTEVMVRPTAEIAHRRLDQIEAFGRHAAEVLHVVREGCSLAPRPWLVVRPGDVLVVQGRMDDIAHLRAREGLEAVEELRVDDKVLRRFDVVMAEGIIPPGSGVEGRRLESLDLSDRYGVTLLGVGRPRHGVHGGRPSDQPLRPGDSVLLVGHEEDLARLQQEQEIHLLERRPPPPLQRRGAVLALGLLALVVATSAAGLLAPAFVIPLAAILAVLLRCISLREAYASLDLRALAVLGGMIPLGIALEESGTAQLLAHGVHGLLGESDPWWTFSASLLVAVALTQVIENAAVAVIMAPVSYQLALAADASPFAFLLGLAICTSTAFMTPVAHESTILVVQAGRYEFRDYLRFGTPLAVLTWIVVIAVLPRLHPLASSAAG